MSDKQDIFGGFDALASDLMSPKYKVGVDPDMDNDDIDFVDDPSSLEDLSSDVDQIVDSPDDDIDSKKDQKDGPKNDLVNKDKDTIAKDIPFKDNPDDDDQSHTDDSDDKDIQGLSDEDEPEVVQYFQEKLFEKFGWDIEEDDKFEKVEDFVDYLSKVIEENSKPEFASEEIKALNEYVKQGGDINKYYQTTNSVIDPDEIDLKSEANQMLVVREYLKTQGYSADKINKRIERYSDTGILEDEAIEAAEFLKDHKKKTEEKLFREQEKFFQEQEKMQQKFFDDVKKEVEQMDEVLGMPLTKSVKSNLINYIFKKESDGKTKYQKEYSSSVRNLLESAYFTMMRDQLPKKINSKATSDATINLRKKLEMKSKRGKNTGDIDSNEKTSSDHSIFGSFASQLAKPKF
jgi:hypothetical protein